MLNIINFAFSLTTINLENLASNICEVFQGEHSETFYQKYCQGRHANGKLHDAYNNYRNKLAKSGLITRRSKSISKTPTEKLENLNIDSNIEEIFIDLKTEVNIDLVIGKWKSSYKKRTELLFTHISTSEYISKFPALEQDEGYKLLYIDVFERYGKDLKAVFPDDFLNKLKDCVKRSKSESVPKIIELIDSEILESNKLFISLMLLPFMFSTTVRRTKKESKKVTKAEIADTFILHFMTCVEADKQMREILKKHLETKAQIQPIMILIGSPIEICWVLISHLKYKAIQPEEAVKICLAGYLALNIRYPDISKNIWIFVQKYIYKISTPYDTVNSTLKTLARDFNCLD